MVSFEYDLTTDDYAAFNLHHLVTSDMGRRQRRAHRVCLTAVTGIASALLVAFLLQNPLGGLIAAVFGAVTVWFIAPHSWERGVRRNIERMAEGDGLGTTGRHVLALDGDGIREDTPNATVAAPWDSVLRVDGTADHVFIYTDPVRAFVVPVRIGSDRLAKLRGLLSEHTAGK